MDAFIGEIRAFGFNYPPQGWALCNGQLMSIQSNTALYAVIGISYGGNGTTNFNLPNLQGSVLIGNDSTPAYPVGQQGGQENVTLDSTQIPTHNHNLQGGIGATQLTQLVTTPSATTYIGNIISVTDNKLGSAFAHATSPVSNVAMGAQSLNPAGNSAQPSHPNMAPYLVMNYCIALEGEFPMRP
jgi:microcystin-dependent protein